MCALAYTYGLPLYLIWNLTVAALLILHIVCALMLIPAQNRLYAGQPDTFTSPFSISAFIVQPQSSLSGLLLMITA